MKHLKTSLLLLGAGVLLAGCQEAAEPKNPEDVVVTVGKATITYDDLTERLMENEGSLTLQRMIILEAIKDQLPADKIKEAEGEVELTIATQKTQAGAKDFESYLLNQGYDGEEQLRNLLIQDRLIGKYIEEELDTSEEGIQKAIDKKAFAPKAMARGIMVDNINDANEIIEDLQDGGKWKDWHDEKNLNVATYQTEGVFPLIKVDNDTFDPYETPADVPTLVQEAVIKAENEGLIPEPIKIGDGHFYVVEVLYDGSMDHFDKHKETIRDQYYTHFLNDHLYVTDRIGLLIQEQAIDIHDERFNHVLSGVLEAVGSYDEMLNMSQSLYDGASMVEPSGDVIEIAELEETSDGSDKSADKEDADISESESTDSEGSDASVDGH